MKRRTMKSRLLAFLLVLCMIVGLTPVYAVDEGNLEAFVVNETKTITLGAGESCSYTFTPDEDGTYILYCPISKVFWFVINGSVLTYGWNSTNTAGVICFGMKAGQQYEIQVGNGSGLDTVDTADVTLIKATRTEGITITEESPIYLPGSIVIFGLEFTPEFGAADTFRWSVSDAGIAEICYETAHSCELDLKAAGTFTLTATSRTDPSVTASIEITVEEPKTIQLGETAEVNLQPGKMGQYNFSANGKAGQYMLMMPWDAMCGWGWHGDILDWFDYYADECRCVVFELPEDGQMTVDVYAPDNEPVSTTLTLVEAIEATDISFPDGDTVQIGVGEQVRVPVELVGGNFIKDLNCYIVDDNGVAWPQDWCGDYIDVYANEVGTTTFVLEGDGVYKELTVNVLPYGYNIPDENK